MTYWLLGGTLLWLWLSYLDITQSLTIQKLGGRGGQIICGTSTRAGPGEMTDPRYKRKPKRSHPWVSWKPGWLTRRDQELRGMVPKVYHCGCGCGWSGLEPSISDGSYERPTADGVVIDRVHYLICPRCFANLSLKEKEHDGLHSRPTQPA